MSLFSRALRRGHAVFFSLWLACEVMFLLSKLSAGEVPLKKVLLRLGFPLLTIPLCVWFLSYSAQVPERCTTMLYSTDFTSRNKRSLLILRMTRFVDRQPLCRRLLTILSVASNRGYHSPLSTLTIFVHISDLGRTTNPIDGWGCRVSRSRSA